MAYKKGNRATTDEQFSKATTIDGSRIDKALGDIVEKHNEIPTGDTEARWTPTTINVSWGKNRAGPRHSNSNPNTTTTATRSGPGITDQLQRDWFPFLVARNLPAEIFPAIQGVPTNGLESEFRNKGYWVNKAVDQEMQSIPRWDKGLGITAPYTMQDCNDVSQQFNTWAAAGGAWGGITNTVDGNGEGSINWKYMTLTIPLYFKDPVILTNVSVFGGQEHPYSPYNAFLDTSGGTNTQPIIATDGYRTNVTTNTVDITDPVMPNPTVGNAFEFECDEEVLDANPAAAVRLAATSGMERPGELWMTTQQNFGDGTVQILLDDEFQPEKPELAKVLYHKTDLRDSVWRFNRNPTTGNRNTTSNGTVLCHDQGQPYEDMEPRFSGGPTWGTWIKQDDMNVPIPANSRVRFCVIVRGYRPSFMFDWHLSLSLLEQTK